MPVAPQRTESFDIRNLQSTNQFLWMGSPYSATEVQTALSQFERTNLMVAMRNAGMWFADIARIFGYASASAASAHYIRECRIRGVEPRLRAQRGTQTSTTTIPDFVNRVVTGERDFTFGVEIETYSAGLGRAQLAVERAGQNCRNEGYTHEGCDSWKVVHDGSIRGGSPAEVVSRVLKGRDGFIEMRNIMLQLKEVGAKVNRSCGMHIHIGVEHLTNRQRGMIIRQYAVMQPQFDLLIPRTRRNTYYAKHRSVAKAMQLAESWNQGSNNSDSGRYWTLNLQSFQKYGTFEFRAHNGSINPQFASAWIQMHMDFIQFCINLADSTTGELDGTLGMAMPYEHEFLDVTRWTSDGERFLMTTGNYDEVVRASRLLNLTNATTKHIMNVLIGYITSNEAIKPILQKVITKHNPTPTV